MAGLFITFEGGEGSGKSSLLERLAARLRERGHDPLVTREPGGTPLAEGIRDLLLDPGLRPPPLTEALLMVAARTDLVATVLRPARQAGRVVLCDRYTDSTLAYQGAGRGLEPALLERLNREAVGDMVPDLTLLLDLDPKTGIERRMRAKGDTNRLDREPLAFHQRVRERYRELAEREPRRFLVLDAQRPTADLAEQAWQAIEPRLHAQPSI